MLITATLREIVVKFCGSLLQASMQDYCVMLEMFEKATPVNTYTNAISAKESEKNCLLTNGSEDQQVRV